MKSFQDFLNEGKNFKQSIKFDEQSNWYVSRECIPDDGRPVFVVHSNSYKSPGKIGHYDAENKAWFKVIEGVKKYIKTPLRWREVLVTTTYTKFLEDEELKNQSIEL
jgi:hypothetical protein